MLRIVDVLVEILADKADLIRVVINRTLQLGIAGVVLRPKNPRRVPGVDSSEVR